MLCSQQGWRTRRRSCPPAFGLPLDLTLAHAPALLLRTVCERARDYPFGHLGIWVFFSQAREQCNVGIRLSGRFAQVKAEAMLAWPGDTEQNVQAA